MISILALYIDTYFQREDAKEHDASIKSEITNDAELDRSENARDDRVNDAEHEVC